MLITTTERETGRKYRVIKSYCENGKFMERSTLRRYSLVKVYIRNANA